MHFGSLSDQPCTPSLVLFVTPFLVFSRSYFVCIAVPKAFGTAITATAAKFSEPLSRLGLRLVSWFLSTSLILHRHPCTDVWSSKAVAFSYTQKLMPHACVVRLSVLINVRNPVSNSGRTSKLRPCAAAWSSQVNLLLFVLVLFPLGSSRFSARHSLSSFVLSGTSGGSSLSTQTPLRLFFYDC